jgi:hypothetical protein
MTTGMLDALVSYAYGLNGTQAAWAHHAGTTVTVHCLRHSWMICSRQMHMFESGWWTDSNSSLIYFTFIAALVYNGVVTKVVEVELRKRSSTSLEFHYQVSTRRAGSCRMYKCTSEGQEAYHHKSNCDSLKQGR